MIKPYLPTLFCKPMLQETKVLFCLALELCDIEEFQQWSSSVGQAVCCLYQVSEARITSCKLLYFIYNDIWGTEAGGIRGAYGREP